MSWQKRRKNQLKQKLLIEKIISRNTSISHQSSHSNKPIGSPPFRPKAIDDFFLFYCCFSLLLSVSRCCRAQHRLHSLQLGHAQPRHAALVRLLRRQCGLVSFSLALSHSFALPDCDGFRNDCLTKGSVNEKKKKKKKGLFVSRATDDNVSSFVRTVRAVPRWCCASRIDRRALTRRATRRRYGVDFNRCHDNSPSVAANTAGHHSTAHHTASDAASDAVSDAVSRF